MADNSPSSGGSGDIIATDELTTINGAAASGFKVQRVKVGYGADGDFNDVSARQGLPITSTPAEDPLGLPTYDDTVASLIAGNSRSQDQRSLLDVLDPLSDNYVAPQAEVVGSAGRTLVQDADGALVAAGKVTNYQGSISLLSTANTATFPCAGHMTAQVMLNVSGAGGANIEVWNGFAWSTAAGGIGITTSGGAPTGNPQAVASGNTPLTVSLHGASMIRVRSTAAGAGTCAFSIGLSPFPVITYGQVTAYQTGGAANLLCTANIATTTTVASTNGQTLNQQIITATTPAAVQVKASAGRITMLQISNGAANVGYLHLQNNAAAASNTASVMTFAIPATAGANISIALPEGGLYMSSGIAYTVSGAIASGDTTVLTAPSIAVNISYI